VPLSEKAGVVGQEFPLKQIAPWSIPEPPVTEIVIKVADADLEKHASPSAIRANRTVLDRISRFPRCVSLRRKL
jgi:hypothetical protein